MEYRRGERRPHSVAKVATRSESEPTVESQNSSSSQSDSAPEPEILLPNVKQFQIETYERDAYRNFCLARLEHFLSLRHLPVVESAEDARLHQRIVERAIYSAFRDCVSAGADGEARRLLGETAERAA
jgi:hypothetical protein